MFHLVPDLDNLLTYVPNLHYRFRYEITIM